MIAQPSPAPPVAAPPVAPASERTAALVIAALTVVVIGGVTLVIFFPPFAQVAGPAGSTAARTVLPEINAALNAASALLLVAGWRLIKRRRIAAHRACMIAAFTASSLFLITYLIHHAQVGSVPFRGTGWLRPLYFALLIPHIVFAALVVPLALLSIYRAWRGRFDRHVRIARLTLPLWLYVSVSGVLVYVLLYHVGP